MQDSERKFLIIGLAREGLAAYRFLRKQLRDTIIGFADQTRQDQLSDEIKTIIKTDTRLQLHFGPDYLDRVNDYDQIIKSPGVPLKLLRPIVTHVVISSPTQLFFDSCQAPIIGITGTKGKSTTTTIIDEVLKAGGHKTVLCGNIGKPALDYLDQIDSQTLVVMELSSHQLQTLAKSPHIAVIQNIVPEHLDYYDDFDDYVTAKSHITQFQKPDDYVLFNAAYKIPNMIAAKSNAQKIPFNMPTDKTGCYSQDGVILYCSDGNEEEILEESGIQLPGKYNIQNVMPAVIIGKMYSIDSQIISQTISNFKGLADRMEFVGTVDGVSYYNDSLSTVPDSAIGAIDALSDGIQTIMVGGFDRGLNFDELGKKIVESKINIVICFPTTGEKIWQAVEKESRMKNLESRIAKFDVTSMVEAVKIAKEQTASGRAVLLSPASPSFGVFKDYHDRGEQFKHAILGQDPG